MATGRTYGKPFMIEAARRGHRRAGNGEKMNRTIWLPLCAALVLLLAGCPSNPEYITDVDEADYPLSAAGFDRGSIISNTPGGGNLSVYYSLCEWVGDDRIDNGAILRITRVTGLRDSAQARFEAAKADLLKRDPNAERLNDGTVTLTKNGEDHAALKASYRSLGISWCFPNSDLLAGQGLTFSLPVPVPRYIELIVWRHEDRVLAFHGSADPKNQDIASAKNLELLDAVNWTRLPSGRESLGEAIRKRR